MAQQDTFRWMYRFWEKNLKPKRKKSITVPELPGMGNLNNNATESAASILDTI
jgi:hypothetical protein